LEKVKKLKKAQSFGIAHPECINLVFLREDGVEGNGIFLLYQYAPEEIAQFMEAITTANSNIIVDPEIHKWLEKKLQVEDPGNPQGI
jgi:hypothetical protein